jgi:hypothetical protein
MKPADHRLKTLKPWTKINPSSLTVSLRYSSQWQKVWVTQ